jgi:benzil reductase ((S)-benzoin forming)
VTRLAVVSGGSRGLGRALCEQALAQGFRVIELSRSAPHAYSIRADLTQPVLAAQALAAALRGVDAASLDEFVFIGNAGVIEPLGAAARQSAAALRANLNVNVVSAITLFGVVIDALQDAPARKVLVNVGSGAAHTARAGLSLYGAAKAGLEQFMRAVALEQAAQRHPFIAVTIDPGALDTGMQSALREADAQDVPAAVDFAQRHARGELASADDVAATLWRIARLPALAGGARHHVREFALPTRSASPGS